MSSMRNAVQRRTYRERAQPLERQKLGLLEKHKDYSLRAADHKQKQHTLSQLRAKAASRNEDEFYFGMLSRISGPSSGRRGPDNKHWDGTVPGDRGNGKGMTVDEVRLLKTQDMGYVRTVRNSVRRQVEALRQRVALAEQGVFRGSDGDEGEDEEDEKDEAGNDVGRASSKGKVAPPKRVLFASTAAEQREAVLAAREGHQLQQPPQSEDPEGEDNEDDDHEQQLQKLRRELRAAEMKLAGLARVEEEMERERARMAKTATSAGIDRKTEKLRKVRVRKR